MTYCIYAFQACNSYIPKVSSQSMLLSARVEHRYHLDSSEPLEHSLGLLYTPVHTSTHVTRVYSSTSSIETTFVQRRSTLDITIASHVDVICSRASCASAHEGNREPRTDRSVTLLVRVDLRLYLHTLRASNSATAPNIQDKAAWKIRRVDQ